MGWNPRWREYVAGGQKRDCGRIDAIIGQKTKAVAQHYSQPPIVLEERAEDVFEAPADQDVWGGRTLDQLLGEQDNLLLLLSFARQQEDAGMAVPTEIVREIEAFLAEPAAELDEDEQLAPRLLDYLYPVV